MNLLIFTSKGDESEKSKAKILNDFNHINSVEIYNTIETLLKRLKIPRENLDLMLLLIGNRKDLEDLISFKDLFFEIPIVLVLPDRKKMTVRQGFKFYPRYISYMDSTLKDVTGVLAKIHDNLR